MIDVNTLIDLENLLKNYLNIVFKSIEKNEKKCGGGLEDDWRTG